MVPHLGVSGKSCFGWRAERLLAAASQGTGPWDGEERTELALLSVQVFCLQGV